MTGPQRGFLLLCSQLGNPERKPLTAAQLRKLALRVQAMPKPTQERELEEDDLRALGYGGEDARRILALLSEEDLLDYYLEKGKKAGCVPVTRASFRYPEELKRKLGLDAPGCLWAKGDLSLLELPKISLVGSRELKPENRVFAREAGMQAAQQGYALVSGNARGADQAAQNAALKAGGRVICLVADAMESRVEGENILYLAEDAFDAPFSAARALSRNRIIHALGEKTLIAQCSLETGGTWAGTERNLRKGYGPVFCFQDGSKATQALIARGADPVTMKQLHDLSGLQPCKQSFL